MIAVRHLNFRFQQERPLFSDAGVVFERGMISGIFGKSGCGKSTLLRLINGSVSLDQGLDSNGEICIDGRPIETMKSGGVHQLMGTVYQDPDCQILFSHVEDELVFGMENHQLSKAEMERRLKEVGDLLKIHHLMDRNPNHLSGGEKQLVIIASILCLNVEVILLDECMAQVDEIGRKRIADALIRLRDQGKTIVMVEHERENLAIADRLYRVAECGIAPIQRDRKGE